MQGRSPDASPTQPAGTHAPAERRESVIGPNLQIVGTIDSGGGVRIEGRLDGDVACRRLTIGQTGVLVGTAVAETAEVEGTVDGKITADSIVLGASARVSGEVVQRKLVIQPGALFEGSVRRMDAAPDAEAKTSGAKASGESDNPADRGAKAATA